MQTQTTPVPVPPLAEFLRWIGEMPAPFKAAPSGFGEPGVPVRAVVSDLFESLFDARPSAQFLSAFSPEKKSKVELNFLCWTLAACHLLWHPALRSQAIPRLGIEKLLVQDLATLAGVVVADKLNSDQERREELIRRTLFALGLLLPGESRKEAEDRLTQVDSVERQKIISEAAAKEKRNREVREAMLKKAAEEAAAKPSRE